MRVSLAMACLNEGLDLQATIATALACNGVLHEVVVVDDGSIDRPRQVTASWEGKSRYSFPN